MMRAVRRCFAWWVIPVCMVGCWAVVFADEQPAPKDPENMETPPAATVSPPLEEGGDLEGWCGATCYDRAACFRLDVPPPACDPVGPKTCADYVSVDYNPNQVPIRTSRYYGECTKKKAYTDGQVLCSITTWWIEEDNGTLFQYCSGDPPLACVGSVGWCQACEKDWEVWSWVPNVVCVHDPKCCEPESPLP